MLALQNLGLFCANKDANVKDTVDVYGTVDVGNTVDVNVVVFNICYTIIKSQFQWAIYMF